MLNNTVVFTTPQETIADKVPADVYQVVLVDVKETDGTDFNTGEPKKQLKFFAEIVEGEEKGKSISFFTSYSWFNGGKNVKPSKLFNLVKTVYAFYKNDVSVREMDIITADDVNGLLGKQIRITTDETEKGWPKVTAFTPIRKEISYKRVERIDEEVPPFEEEEEEVEYSKVETLNMSVEMQGN